MIALALELSSAQGSIALLRDAAVLGEEAWNEKDFRGQHLFGLLSPLLEKASLKPEDIELFVAGRGPGSYSGTRIAVTAAQALALPGGRRVYTVSSGEALAAELAVTRNAARMAIIGDARRDTLWFGLFEQAGKGVKAVQPWRVLEIDHLPSNLEPGILLASPDRARLLPALQALTIPHSVRWVEEDACPRAAWVGKIALEKIARGEESEPVTPIYMHPAVGRA